MDEDTHPPASNECGPTVLFLDVDGVLNQCGHEQDVLTTKAGLLKKIVTKTACSIIVSSTWRRRQQMRDLLVKLLRQSDVAVTGWTPCLDMINDSGFFVTGERGHEIQAWLDENPHVMRFVILDDCKDMAHLGTHLVQTESFVGLTEEIADEVIRRLTNECCGSEMP
jgi:hypothetical protein